MIIAKNIVKRYDEVLALDTLSLNIEDGEIFGLLGPNGAGKTTFINCVIGMTSYQSGEIYIDDMTMKDHEKQIKGQIGVVPQDLALYMNETAYNNVKYFASLYGIKGKALKKAVEKALEFVGLWDKKHVKVKTFSGGMKRRLNIACAIAHNPKMVVMDEPTVGIDPQSRNHILESVKALNATGVTIIYTSHYMEEVELLCNKVAIVDHGKLIAEGTKDSLRQFVQSDRILEIEISQSNFNQIESIKAVEGVKDCYQKDKTLIIILDKHQKNLEDILLAITKYDTEIIAVNMKEASLEDVFLTLTGRSLRD